MKTKHPSYWRDRLLVLSIVVIITLLIIDVTREIKRNDNYNYNVKLNDRTLKRLLKPIISNQKVENFYGIDISHWNGDVLKEMGYYDSLTFVICKATEGLNYTDPDYESNMDEIREKGWIGGAYHFYLFGKDPIEQADHFLKTIGNLRNSEIAPILDIEQASLPTVKSIPVAKLQVDLLLFLDALEAHFERTPIIYTDLNFANTYLSNQLFAHYPLWLAEYSGAIEPQIPVTWVRKGFKFWQKTDHYDLHSDWTDFDLFKGTRSELTQ